MGAPLGKKRRSLVERINELLGTDLELKRVPLAELERLHDALAAKFGGAPRGPPGGQLQGLLDTPLVEALRKKLAHKKLEDMTVGDLLAILQEGSGGKGVLGFGILPALLRGRR